MSKLWHFFFFHFCLHLSSDSSHHFRLSCFWIAVIASYLVMVAICMLLEIFLVALWFLDGWFCIYCRVGILWWFCLWVYVFCVVIVNNVCGMFYVVSILVWVLCFVFQISCLCILLVWFLVICVLLWGCRVEFCCIFLWLMLMRWLPRCYRILWLVWLLFCIIVW